MQNTGFVLINLQPYREKIKKDKIRQAALLMGFFVMIGVASIFLLNQGFSGQISNQESRNDFLKKKNSELDAQIKDISNLRENIKETLAKRRVVESLQVNRSDGVIILNEVAKRLPDGTLLKSVKRVANNITIIGQTQSQSKVSSYMTSLKEYELFGDPKLVEIKAVDVITPPRTTRKDDKGETIRFNEFTILLPIKNTIVEVEEDSSKAVKPAAKKVKE